MSHHCHQKSSERHAPGTSSAWWIGPWMATCLYASGAMALVWLLLRSGTKPSRFTYPCQQAAFSSASLAFGVPLVGAVVTVRRRAASALCTPLGVAVALVGLLATVGLWSGFSRADSVRRTVLQPPADYRARVFHVSECPEDRVGDRFVGLDNLLTLMGRDGLKFFQSAGETLTSGPDGIIAANDVVIIKINYQWPERGGSNTDVLRGLIHRIVNHPDGFNGEIAVCENSQSVRLDGFDRPENNAQDHGQSPHDVVVYFQGLGYTVFHYSWRARRFTLVEEYSDGDMTDGYVVLPYDEGVQGRVSYPKFQTDYGTYISVAGGIWDPGSSTYDRDALKYINLPVLKSHGAVYGATACVKNYVGTATVYLDTYTHESTRYGILGAILAEIQPADLNLLDCIWVNGHPEEGPQTTYELASRRDELVASTDPVAADIWAVTNILIPAFLDNLYVPPWPDPSADPEDPDGDFREYLDNSMSELLDAGYSVTNDLAQIDTFFWNGDGDFDGDSDVEADDADQFSLCYTGSGGGPVEPACQGGDFDSDDDVDCDDWDQFVLVWTDPGMPPYLPVCLAVCGDGVVEESETCDIAIPTGQPGACPDDCDSGDPCIVGTLLHAGTCVDRCDDETITEPEHGDGCCPPGANAINDDDCEPVCGNGVCEPGEEIACLADCDCVEDADCDDDYVCTYDQCITGVCSNTPRDYGDIDGSGTRNVFDIFCILDLIAGEPVEPECAAVNADVEPCVANGTLNVFDVFAVLSAIAGTDPCCG